MTCSDSQNLSTLLKMMAFRHSQSLLQWPCLPHSLLHRWPLLILPSPRDSREFCGLVNVFFSAEHRTPTRSGDQNSWNSVAVETCRLSITKRLSYQENWVIHAEFVQLPWPVQYMVRLHCCHRFAAGPCRVCHVCQRTGLEVAGPLLFFHSFFTGNMEVS
jgi:hypothetical protein